MADVHMCTDQEAVQVDGWMDGRVDGSMDGSMDAWIYGRQAGTKTNTTKERKICVYINFFLSTGSRPQSDNEDWTCHRCKRAGYNSMRQL